MATKQKLMTPLDYVSILAGAPPPPEEPDPVVMPVPTPVYMPNPRTIDENQMFGFQGGMDPFAPQNPFGGPSSGGPILPPPIAPPPPPNGFMGSGGFFAPDGGAFG